MDWGCHVGIRDWLRRIDCLHKGWCYVGWDELGWQKAWSGVTVLPSESNCLCGGARRDCSVRMILILVDDSLRNDSYRMCSWLCLSYYLVMLPPLHLRVSRSLLPAHSICFLLNVKSLAYVTSRSFCEDRHSRTKARIFSAVAVAGVSVTSSSVSMVPPKW